MGIIAFNGFPHSVSILRSNGIERRATYHPIKQPIPDMAYIDEFISGHCEGVYLKWLNKKSGYDYWLFNPQLLNKFKVSDLGRVQSTDTNRARALSSTLNVGKNITQLFTVTTHIKKGYNDFVEYILASPEVYLFQPDSMLATVSCAEFIRVFIRPGNFIVSTGASNTVKLKITFELDQKNTQTII